MSIIDNSLVQDFGILSELVYNDDYFIKNEQNELDILINSEDSNKLINSYEIITTRDYGNGFQSMLVESDGKYTVVSGQNSNGV